MRRRRPATHPVRSPLTDETGEPITFAIPGNPTPEERRRYAAAVERARTPAPLTPQQEAERTARLRRRRELLAELGVYAND
jgi:hypothetical protein